MVSFSGDILGLGSLWGGLTGTTEAVAQAQANAQLQAQQQQIKAQRYAAEQQAMLTYFVVGGVLFLGLLYILLKD